MLRSGLSALKSGGLNCERGSTLPLRLCRGLWLFCAPASWSAKGGARGIYSLASSEDEKRLERCTMSSIGEDLLTVALCPGLRGSDSANDDITPQSAAEQSPKLQLSLPTVPVPVPTPRPARRLPQPGCPLPNTWGCVPGPRRICLSFLALTLPGSPRRFCRSVTSVQVQAPISLQPPTLLFVLPAEGEASDWASGHLPPALRLPGSVF